MPRYYISQLEGPYVYHTTPYFRLVQILRSGYLKAGVHQAICFTTDIKRHLSDFPLIPWFFTHDTAIKVLASDIPDLTPCYYELPDDYIPSEFEAKSIFDEEYVRKKYGPYFHKNKTWLIYEGSFTWMHENEFRVFRPILKLPESFTVLVAFHQQRTALRSAFGIEATVDPVFHEIFSRINMERNMREKARRKVGQDIYQSARYVEARPREGKVVLYDIPAELLELAKGKGTIRPLPPIVLPTFDLEVPV